ncbi:MAG TPA: GntR family transcriptional regulator [Allosphingosinicella sp.]|jgi:DNA-binding GntR family transcriptional regulator
MTVAAAIRLTTAERLAARVGEAIRSGELPPGAPLREEELARSHGVSRHVVREVLRLLVGESLATYEAYKGARVSYISAEDVRDIFRTRRLFELPALRKMDREAVQALALIHGRYSAAVEACDWRSAFDLDHDFHSKMVAAAGSKRMLRWHSEIFHSLSRAHLVRPEFEEQGLRASVGEHAEIVVALAAGDLDRAERALSAHLDHSEALLSGR